MVFQVPAAKKSVKQDKFEFQVDADGPVYTLPAMKFLKPETTAAIEGSIAALRNVFEEHAPGSFAKLENNDQLEALVEAWGAESGTSLGESKASASS